MDEKAGFNSKKAVVSFVPPTAGMFVWLAVHLPSHPDFEQTKRDEGKDGVNKMLYDLWTELAESNVSSRITACTNNTISLHLSHRFLSARGTSSMLSQACPTRGPKTLAFSA
jgi:hypothetical protein